MSRIAIVSTNKELVRFFELELELCGHEAVSLRNLNALNDTYDIVFADIDTVKITESQMANMAIKRISASATEENVLLWPTSVSDIRRAVAGLAVSDGEAYPSSGIVYLSDADSCTVSLDGKKIKLSKTELAILELLCAANGGLVPRRQINRLLGDAKTNMVDVYICNIRKKLESPSARRVIFTERSHGYRTTLTLIK